MFYNYLVVFPAKARIHPSASAVGAVGSRLRENDGIRAFSDK
jgi:hypothetical protein